MNDRKIKAESDIEKIMRQELERRKYRFEQFYPTRSGFELDFAFPELRIGIECDGERWHSSAEARRRDRFRDYILRRGGWVVYRFNGEMIRASVCSCVNSIIPLSS